MRCAPPTRCLPMAVLALVICWLAGAMPALGDSLPQKRVALVIGNSHYNDGTDISGTEDALAMEQALRELDFQVLEPVLDARKETIEKNLEKLSMQVSDATLVAFFYSGHGFQLEGKNFLYPVGGDTTAKASVSLDAVIDAVESAPATATKILFIDACRTSEHFSEKQRGPAEPPNTNSTDKILFAFAASPGQVSVSNGPKDRSPYTIALLRYLREPGLEVKDLLGKVRSEAIQATGQVPSSFGYESFYLRPPVSVRATIEKPENDLILLLNGEILFDREAPSRNPIDLRLHAGDNPIVLLVASQRTYRNTHSWGKTEGWGYCLRLFGPGGTELKLPHCNGRDPCFSASEEVPFKDGSHHGKVFTVSRAVLYVDPMTAALTLTNAETEIWNQYIPLSERNQDVLYEVKATEVLAKALTVDSATLTRSLSQIPGVVATFFPQLPPFKIPDLGPWVARVRGNQDFRDSVKSCMKDREAERVKDLQAGVQAALKGNPLPLKIFDDGLSACVQSGYENRTGKHFEPQEIRVWTAFEDLSEQPRPFECPHPGGAS
jgi:hypothetical protein